MDILENLDVAVIIGLVAVVLPRILTGFIFLPQKLTPHTARVIAIAVSLSAVSRSRMLA